MPEHKITIEVGEKVTLKPSGKVKGDDCHFHPLSGGALVTRSDEDIREKATLEVTGYAVGREKVSYGPDLSETLTAEQRMSGRGRATARTHDIFVVDVVAKGEKGKRAQAQKRVNAAAAGAEVVGGSSSQHDGLLPMNEVQEAPSQNSPYGLDQENKPVAPHPSMTAGDADFSNVARASETAEATGPQAPAAPSKRRASGKRSSKKASSKS
jgi:hypothetical protein